MPKDFTYGREINIRTRGSNIQGVKLGQNLAVLGPHFVQWRCPQHFSGNTGLNNHKMTQIMFLVNKVQFSIYRLNKFQFASINQCSISVCFNMSRLSVYRKYRGTSLYQLFVPWTCDSYRGTLPPQALSMWPSGSAGLWSVADLNFLTHMM